VTSARRLAARAAFALVAVACTSRQQPDVPLRDAPSIDAPVLDAGAMDAPGADAWDARTGDAGTGDARPGDASTRSDAPAPGIDARIDAPLDPLDVGERPRRDAPDTAPVGCGVAVAGACAEGAPSYFDGPCSSRELHLVTHYQPLTPEVTVAVERVGVPIVLSLTSYEPTVWNLVVSPGVVLEQVVLDGYNRQTVFGVPPGVPVTDRSGSAGGVACAIRWPYDTGGCDTEGLVASLARLTGLTPTSFLGCSEGAGYRIGP
jgi:hypothetical protein